jgi:hypothetical protein
MLGLSFPPNTLSYLTIDNVAELITNIVPDLSGHGLTSFLYNYICDEGSITVSESDMVVTEFAKVLDILDSVEWREFSDEFGGVDIRDALFASWRDSLRILREENDILEISPYVMVVEW